ncbi:28 kDa heat- and acid-stable phosphoprotein [Drosophila miranda]|uniref:28 kDa heat- and acid-stable phosphoprotein n=1 Tax=Drosophila miranda TaxID=7229 RepID=UPI0007E63626|nr:28 kDa heat- and acid-stable phosphoprotein [Drosophila miranda]
MPRGKFVNHKGRSRHFTSPEELQQESEEESDQSSGSGSGEETGGDKASGSAATSKSKPPATRKTATRPAHRQKQRPAVSSSESDSEESEDDSEAEARDAKKGVASLIEIENPNRVTKKATQKIATLKLDDGGSSTTSSTAAAKPELSRREREQIEKQKARQRYEKLHAAGKTTEAKADLARLALIRQQREEAAAKREAEKKVAADTGKKPGAK